MALFCDDFKELHGYEKRRVNLGEEQPVLKPSEGVPPT